MKIYKKCWNILTGSSTVKPIIRNILLTVTILKSNLWKNHPKMKSWTLPRRRKKKKLKKSKKRCIIFSPFHRKNSKDIQLRVQTGTQSTKICLLLHMNTLVREIKAIKKDFWCSGPLKTQLFLRRFSIMNPRSQHANSVYKIQTW